jgi:hypothetical protein
MIYIKSELSKILGKIEELDPASSLTCDRLYPLIEMAYLLISDYYEIDQCHSIIHHLANQMRELEKCRTSPENIQDQFKHVLAHAQRSTEEELRIFISHL